MNKIFNMAEEFFLIIPKVCCHWKMVLFAIRNKITWKSVSGSFHSWMQRTIVDSGEHRPSQDTLEVKAQAVKPWSVKAVSKLMRLPCTLQR